MSGTHSISSASSVSGASSVGSETSVEMLSQLSIAVLQYDDLMAKVARHQALKDEIFQATRVTRAEVDKAHEPIAKAVELTLKVEDAKKSAASLLAEYPIKAFKAFYDGDIKFQPRLLLKETAKWFASAKDHSRDELYEDYVETIRSLEPFRLVEVTEAMIDLPNMNMSQKAGLVKGFALFADMIANTPEAKKNVQQLLVALEHKGFYNVGAELALPLKREKVSDVIEIANYIMDHSDIEQFGITENQLYQSLVLQNFVLLAKQSPTVLLRMMQESQLTVDALFKEYPDLQGPFLFMVANAYTEAAVLASTSPDTIVDASSADVSPVEVRSSLTFVKSLAPQAASKATSSPAAQ